MRGVEIGMEKHDGDRLRAGGDKLVGGPDKDVCRADGKDKVSAC